MASPQVHVLRAAVRTEYKCGCALLPMEECTMHGWPSMQAHVQIRGGHQEPAPIGGVNFSENSGCQVRTQ